MRPLVALLVAAPAATAIHVRGAKPGHSAGEGSPVPLGADVIVYGNTPAAITAALAAARGGAKTVLLNPEPRLGGMLSGGLGAPLGPTPSQEAVSTIGGLAKTFFLENAKVYNSAATQPLYLLEPHVAEGIFTKMLANAGVPVLASSRPVSSRRLSTNNTWVESVQLGDGTELQAGVFIDGSYEGDLAAYIGAEYFYGREAVVSLYQPYSEPNAGRRDPLVAGDIAPVSPYTSSGDIDPLFVTDATSIPVGDRDERVQAYTFLPCLTNNKRNKVPFPAPTGYDVADWNLLITYLQGLGPNPSLSQVLSLTPLPNSKFAVGSVGPLSIDAVGLSRTYPDARYDQRQPVYEAHLEYVQGFLYTLATAPGVPASIQGAISKFGLCADEWQSNGYWPEQLYVREARRVRGDATFNGNTITNQTSSIGAAAVAVAYGDFTGAYSTRAPCLLAADGKSCPMLLPGQVVPAGATVALGGDGDAGLNTHGPYQVPAYAIMPAGDQVNNLMVPTAPSASHVATVSLAQEPTLMALGEAAGVIAALAAASGVAVQDVDPAAVQAALTAAGAVLNPY